MNPMSNHAPDRLLGDRRRVVVEHVRPTVDGGEFPAKATRGLPLRVSARAFADGHDPLLAWVWHWPGARPLARDAPPTGMVEVPMESSPRTCTALGSRRAGSDHGASRWSASSTSGEAGLADLTIRFEAGVDVELDLADGAALAATRAELPVVSKSDRRALTALATKLAAPTPAKTRVQLATREATMGLMRRTADLSHATIAGPYPLWVDREVAGYSAWYEMFPRSEGAVPPRSGTFKTAQRRLPAIAAMGFSVLYLPPIHPIGRPTARARTTARSARRATREAPGRSVGPRRPHGGGSRPRHHR